MKHNEARFVLERKAYMQLERLLADASGEALQLKTVR
jgi:hypothetical protein